MLFSAGEAQTIRPRRSLTRNSLRFLGNLDELNCHLFKRETMQNAAPVGSWGVAGTAHFRAFHENSHSPSPVNISFKIRSISFTNTVTISLLVRNVHMGGARMGLDVWFNRTPCMLSVVGIKRAGVTYKGGGSEVKMLAEYCR